MDQKTKFWNELWKVLLGKVPYIILGWFVYPFLNRTKIREKIKSGNFSKDTLDFWYMMNDDEITKYGVDYDVKKIGRAKTKLGHFLKSYYFNPLRNPAYNYSLTFNPVINKYDIKEVEYNTLTKNGKEVSPLTWARWTWMQKNGSLNNRGEQIVLEESVIGKSKVWFDPHNDEDVWYCRWSKASKYSYLFWDVYYTFRIGAFGQPRYDIIIKNQHILKYKYKRSLAEFRRYMIDLKEFLILKIC